MKMLSAARTSLALIASVGILALSADDAPSASVREDKASVTEKIYNERFGGKIKRPGTGIGVTGFVIVGNAIPTEEVEKVKKTIGTQLKHEQRTIRLESMDGLPSRGMVAAQGLNLGVFVVADNKLPPMLVAPEEGWSLVNVSRLFAGLTDDAVGKRLFASRCRGELLRAFCYVAGGGSSQYDGNIMGVTEVGQLDIMNPDLTVGDTTARCRKYLETLGVTPPIMVTYSRAVKEGWAPQPTNDYQRAIWEKVHAIPDKPITIDYDPAKDR